MQNNNILKDIFSLGIIAMLVASLIYFFNVYGPLAGHSFTPNYTWVKAFSSQFLQGDIYPRWLYQSYQGAGSPAFYFYAPLPYWVSAITGLIFCPACSSVSLFMIGPSMLLGLASVSCYYFIKTVSSRKIALLSSLLYFALPYHFIIDFWIRNSWGELAAYIFMPVLLLAIRLSSYRKKYLVVAAVAYAGLLFSHLPTALLFSPMMLLYACLEFSCLKGFKRIVFIVLLGAGLSAIYIIPALTTQGFINREFWDIFYPVDWLWFSGKYSIIRGQSYLIVAVYSILFIWIHGRLFPANEFKREKLLLMAMISSFYCFFLMTDLSLPLWEHVSLLKKVQFPWRVISILDLSIVIVFALTLERIKHDRYMCLAYITIVFLYVVGIFIWFSHELPDYILSSKDETVNELIYSGFEPAEYRTKWLARDYPDLGYRELETILSGIPTASIIRGEGDIIRVQDLGNELIIQLNAETNVRLRLRRFYYPGWYLMNSALLDNNIPIELSPYYALIEATLPAGNYSVSLLRHPLPEEYLGTAVSIICLLFCCFLLLQCKLHSTCRD